MTFFLSPSPDADTFFDKLVLGHSCGYRDVKQCSNNVIKPFCWFFSPLA